MSTDFLDAQFSIIYFIVILFIVTDSIRSVSKFENLQDQIENKLKIYLAQAPFRIKHMKSKHS
jgi:hypothetical protein